MAGIRWTKEENDFLMKNYENLDKDKILDGLSMRSWDAIKLKANIFKIKRYKNDERLADLNILLNDTNETYYWIGFIMADGHIENEKRLSINLSIKDKEHLEKFKSFINFKNELTLGNNEGHDNVKISVMDTKYLKKLSDKFDIKSYKTYESCNIKSIKNDDLLLSLIIGFIDGDGYIGNQTKRKDFRLTIKCHKSWLNNLKYILNTINRITYKNCNTSVKLTKCKRYSYINVCDSCTLKELKKKMLRLNIPYMKRKWDVINFDYESRYETKRKNKSELIKIISNNKNIKVKDIAIMMNLSEEAIYGYKRQLKI